MSIWSLSIPSKSDNVTCTTLAVFTTQSLVVPLVPIFVSPVHSHMYQSLPLGRSFHKLCSLMNFSHVGQIMLDFSILRKKLLWRICLVSSLSWLWSSSFCLSLLWWHPISVRTGHKVRFGIFGSWNSGLWSGVMQPSRVRRHPAILLNPLSASIS